MGTAYSRNELVLPDGCELLDSRVYPPSSMEDTRNLIFTVAIQFNCLFDNIPSIKENGKQCIRWHLKDNIVAIIRFLVQNVAKEVVF